MTLEQLYLQMTRMRRFEEALADLYAGGYVSGEMHLGIGEEAIAAGIAANLREGDALALDYRPTPVLVGRGVDLGSMLAEVLGSEQGLCRGHGGHMHLYSPEHLAVSTGIVGSPAPLGAGLAMAAARFRPGSVAVATFGDGAANQGMVLETLNLAVVWKLPVVFVCKDNGWAVTTRSSRLTGGTLIRRARAFGMPAVTVDGRDVTRVEETMRRSMDRARRGRGPSFVLARCRRPRGHFEDDPLVRAVRHPSELWAMLPELLGGNSGVTPRVRALARFGRTLLQVAVDQWMTRWDPLQRAARRLSAETTHRLALEASAEMNEAMRWALEQTGR
jgi:pyruvate dehydrogenase E1 component alpha subunit